MSQRVDTYLRSMFGLEGRVAAVIGGGGFLCSAMAEGLAQAGAAVAVLDKNLDNAKAVASRITEQGAQAIALPIDVTKKDAHVEAHAAIRQALGDVDVLINGAGINAPTPVMDIQLEEWHAIIDSHVTATLFACQVFGARMLERGRGSVINLSSASAGPPLSKAFTYSVAKSGVYNLTQNLAREWAKTGVRVNALRPGFFPTEWSMKNFITPERAAAILGHTPMGRYGKPGELVGAVLWLASDASSFVTGSHVTVDGGFTCMTI